MTNDIDINKVVVSDKLLFSTQDFTYFNGYKDDNNLGLYAYPFQKWVHLEKICNRMYVFYNKRRRSFRYVYGNLGKR